MNRIISSAFIISLAVGQAMGATAPLNETVLPNVPKLIERFNAGPYGAIWRLPELAFMRDLIAEKANRFMQDTGVDFPTALADLRRVVIRGGATQDAAGVPSSEKTIAFHFPHHAKAVQQALVKDTLKQKELFPSTLLGEWVVFGPVPKDVAELVISDAPKADEKGSEKSEADVSSAMASTNLTEFLKNPSIQQDMLAGLHAFSLPAMTQSIRFDEHGTSEVVRLTDCHPPLMAVDLRELSMLPPDQLMVGACGVDGARLERLLKAWSQDFPALAARLSAFDQEADKNGYSTWEPLAHGWKGTLWFAISPGAPFPTVTVGFSGSAELDAMMIKLAEAGQVNLADARKEALVLPTPPKFPFLIQVRRTATQWVMSTDQRVMDAIESGTAGGWSIANLPKGSAPVGLFMQDNKAVVRTMLGYLPMLAPLLAQARGDGGDGGSLTKSLISDAAKIMTALSVHLPASSGFVEQDANGVTIRGNNVTVAMMPAAVMAGMMLPTIGIVRSMAQRKKSGVNMSQIYGSMIAWSTDEGSWPPPSFEELAKKQSLPKQLFRSPNNPSVVNPYLFVTPIEDPSSQQPVLLEDPACNKGTGINICFGDAHVQWIKAPAAQRIWQEALRLAALPKAKNGGIELADWSAVEDLWQTPTEKAAPIP